MKKNSGKGIGLFVCLCLLLAAFSGCKIGMASKNPDKKGKAPVAAESDKEAKLRAAESYEEIIRVMKKRYDKWEASSLLWAYDEMLQAVDFAVAETADGAVAKNESAYVASGGGEETGYSKTNVQVEGIDEADVVKTDGTCLYILNTVKGKIAIVCADGEQLSIVSEILLQYDDEKEYKKGLELYLAGDRLIVITEQKEKIPKDKDREYSRDYSYGKNRTGLMTFDISDKTAPKLISEVEQDGNYISSRCVDGYVYLFTNYHSGHFSTWVDYDEIMPKESEEALEGTVAKEEVVKAWFPEAGGKLIAPENFFISDETDVLGNFLVLTSMKIDAPERYADVKALLSYGDNVYVSNAYIYAGSSRWRNYRMPYDRTELYRFSYQDGVIAQAGQVTVKGMLNNQFSMDEYKGNLRIVTTANEYIYDEKELLEDLDDINGDGVVDEDDIEFFYNGYCWYSPLFTKKQSNALYIYNENLALVGSIENLAPEEHIESARLMGDVGYFVTFRQTDPLFSVDLSDPSAPKVLGTLKIPGFSEYLHPFGENLLLGIGYDADEKTGRRNGVKLSMFDVSNPKNVVEVHKLILEDYTETAAGQNHKCVLVDVEKNLIGVPVNENRYGNLTEHIQKNDYYVYGYDAKTGFYEKMSDGYAVDWMQPIKAWDYSMASGIAKLPCRGVYIGKWFYLIQPCHEVRAYNMDGWKLEGNVILEPEKDEEMAEQLRIAQLQQEPLVIEVPTGNETEYFTEEITEGSVRGSLRSYDTERKITHMEFKVNARGSGRITLLFASTETGEVVRKTIYEITVGDDYKMHVDSITEVDVTAEE